nr:hypothetical protein [Tanacetum cinerariifolium]
MLLERLAQPIAQPTTDPLALLSNVSNAQHGLPSSSTSSITPLTPPRANSTDDLIENLTSTLALLTQSDRTFLPQTNNQLRTSSNPRNQATVQDSRVVVQNGQARPGQARTTEQPFDDDVDEQPIQDLALNVDNVFQTEECDDFDSDVDKALTAQTMFMANLSSANPITNEAGPSYVSYILSEVQDHDQYLDDTCAYQEEHVMHDSVQLDHVVDLHADHTSVSNMIPYDQYVKDNDMSVVHSNASSVPNDTFMMIYDDMCEPFAPYVSNSSRNAVVKNSLTAELATYREQVELYERRAKFELTEREQKINEQLRLVISDRNFKEETLKRELHSIKLKLTSTINHNKSMDSIGNNPPTPEKDTPDFDSIFVIRKMQASLQGKDNVIRQLKKQLFELQVTSSDTECTIKVRTTDSQLTKVTDPVTNLQAQNDRFRAENDKVKQHYKQLYDSIKIIRAKHIEQVTKLTVENVTLKTSVSQAKVQPSVPTRTKHAVDVELIVPRLRNNRDAHLDYLRHLKESVETIRDIVEEAKVVSPLDRSIASACRYTQYSQELLEYEIGTCPQGSQQQAKQLTHTPLIRKKQVTVPKPSDRQDSNKNKHVVTQKIQKTNVHVPHSTGPKNNHKTNRISLAKGANKLPIEDLARTNKSHLRTLDHVDSSSRLKRTKVPKTPQQNEVVKRRNRTLVEAARTMLIFSKALIFLWAEAVATAVFSALCYPTNDCEDLRKLQPTADTGIFVGYAPSRKGYRIYNKRTRRIMETIHVQFDELTKPMALVHLNPPRADRPGSPAQAVQAPVTSASTPLSTTIDQDA